MMECIVAAASAPSTFGTENTTIPPQEEPSKLIVFSQHYALYHGYISVCVCVFGMLANTANIVVLNRKNMITSTNVILMWLAVADLFTMLDYFPFVIHFFILRDLDLAFMQTRYYSWICFLLFHANFSIVCHTVAIWLTIALATFRFLYIWFPGRGALFCSLRNARIAVLSLVLLTVLICVPNFIVNDYQAW